jgi:hypothetical protein
VDNPNWFLGFGFQGNSWTFAHTVGQQQGCVPKDQPIVGQPVVKHKCAHFATLEKHVLGCIHRAPTSSGMPKNGSHCCSNPQSFLILMPGRFFYHRALGLIQTAFFFQLNKPALKLACFSYFFFFICTSCFVTFFELFLEPSSQHDLNTLDVNVHKL